MHQNSFIGKYGYFLIALFFVLYFKSTAQQLDSTLIDSMNYESKRALGLLQKGKHGEAIKIGDKVLRYTETGDYDSLNARIYGILSVAHMNLSNDSLSFSYLEKALGLRIKLKDTTSIIISYSDLGIYYLGQNNIEKSNQYYKKAIELGKRTNNKDVILYPLTNIAANLINEERYDKALVHLEEAEKIMEKSEIYRERQVRAKIYVNLCIVHYFLGNKKAFEAYFEKGTVFAEEHHFFQDLADFYYCRAYLFSEDKKFEEAYYALDEYVVIADTVNTIKEFETAKQIEADNFLRENKEKLKLANQERELHEAANKKSKVYSFILGIFSLFLIISIFFVFKNNKKFKKEKERAEKLAQAKSDFYAEISHELRTPLYAVIELSGLLSRENVNKRHKIYLESLNFSGTHLLSLINNVLELNKIESGTLKIELLEFNLSTMLSNIIESLEYALNDSKNQLHLNHDEKIQDQLIGDSLKLSQIFINLISNAIKFTNKGNIYVSSKLIDETDKNITVYFEVKDDGIGIPLEKQSKIFEEFYQENVKMEATYKGTGLGLSIVKRFVSAMGGDVRIKSEEAKGTSFSFELVLGKDKQSRDDQQLEQELVDDLRGKRFLVVDDNKINQLVTKKILKQIGIEAIAVSSGEEAVEYIIDDNRFDCILMDVNMPGLDGFQTTELIRNFEKGMPIIALTAASTEELKGKVKEFGMNDYVIKPFLKADFLHTIHQVLVQKENLLS